MGLLVYSLFSVSRSEADDRTFISTTKARSMAMGGAYTAVTYKNESMLWNPAGIEIPKGGGQQIRVYLNVVAAPFVLSGLGSMVMADSIESGNDDDEETPMTDAATLFFMETLPFFFKSGLLVIDKLALSANMVEDVLPHETFEWIHNRSDKEENAFDNKSHNLGLKYQFTPDISAGATLSIYDLFEQNERNNGNSITLGAMYSPLKNLSLGMTCFNGTRGATHVLEPMERIVDGSLNFGMSYRPDNDTEITTDIRNLTHSDESAYGELHYGIERKLTRWFSVRGGYYKENNKNDDIFSFGIRLKNINYTFIKNTSEDIRYHLIQVVSTLKF